MRESLPTSSSFADRSATASFSGSPSSTQRGAPALRVARTLPHAGRPDLLVLPQLPAGQDDTDAMGTWLHANDLTISPPQAPVVAVLHPASRLRGGLEAGEVAGGEHGRRIRAGVSDSATGSNQSWLHRANSAGGRRARRRPPANRLLADVLARRLDDVHVQLFVLDRDGFHAVRSDYRARAEVARGRQTASVGLPVDCIG